MEFRDEDREADLEWKCDLGIGGDWNWSQNLSGDSAVLSRELEGLLELRVGLRRVLCLPLIELLLGISLIN